MYHEREMWFWSRGGGKREEENWWLCGCGCSPLQPRSFFAHTGDAEKQQDQQSKAVKKANILLSLDYIHILFTDFSMSPFPLISLIDTHKSHAWHVSPGPWVVPRSVPLILSKQAPMY